MIWKIWQKMLGVIVIVHHLAMIFGFFFFSLCLSLSPSLSLCLPAHFQSNFIMSSWVRLYQPSLSPYSLVVVSSPSTVRFFAMRPPFLQQSVAVCCARFEPNFVTERLWTIKLTKKDKFVINNNREQWMDSRCYNSMSIWMRRIRALGHSN